MDNERSNWSELVAANVPGVTSFDISRIVDIIMNDESRNFWHAASIVQNRLPECGCNDCINKRYGIKKGE